jgi:hypothetical protein
MITRTLLMTAFLSACSVTPAARGFVLPEGDAGEGKETFVLLGCASCHTVSGVSDLPAPVATPPIALLLGGRVEDVPTEGQLVTAIIHPSHQISPQIEERLALSGHKSRMGDYKSAMSVQELVDLVAFLQTVYAPIPPAKSPDGVQAHRGT